MVLGPFGPPPSMTRQAMVAVLEGQPELQDFGFGVYDRRSKTAQQAAAEFAQSRNAMFEEGSLIQFEA